MKTTGGWPLASAAIAFLVLMSIGCRVQSRVRETTIRPRPLVLDIVYGVYHDGHITLEFTITNNGEGALAWIDVEAAFFPDKKLRRRLPKEMQAQRWSNEQAQFIQRFDPPLGRRESARAKLSVATPGLESFLRENYLLLADISGSLMVLYNDMPIYSDAPSAYEFAERVENIRVVTPQEYERIRRP